MGYDEAVSYKGLLHATIESSKGVRKKSGVQNFYNLRLLKCYRLQQDLLHNRYKLKPGHVVQIYYPKRREALAPWFEDKVWQRSMCIHGVYDDLTGHLFPENYACQINKGTDKAIRDLRNTLRQHYLQYHDNKLYAMHLDIKHYFADTPHEEIHKLDQQLITDRRFLPYLDEIVDGFTSGVVSDVHGICGTSLGSVINQLHQTSLLHSIDIHVRSNCYASFRYMDDTILFDRDKEILKSLKQYVTEAYNKIGLRCKVIQDCTSISQGVYFLRKLFILTSTGKVVMKLPKCIYQDEIKTLKYLKRQVDTNRLTYDHVQMHYQSWAAYASYCGQFPMIVMNKQYTSIFRRKPEYKVIRRIYDND